MRESIGRYRITGELGQGGMGVVYSARDDRLERAVAIKTIHDSAEPAARERLWREARAAASVNHPNVCQVYEVAEEDGELYIAMELLEGESLAARIARGPAPISETLQTVLGVLSALDALHRRDLVHRDLKPSNVFLTAHGVKLLDFGLARPLAADLEKTDLRLTAPGMVVGTPRYMAPEQWTDKVVGPASDLFAVGALVFEMLTGKPAFGGETVVEVYHAVVYEQPPALAGGRSVMAIDRVIQRALCKRPEDRYASAEEMAREARAILTDMDATDALRVQMTTRLIVLPFRVLRPDADTEFLAVSVPEAITSSLSGIESLVVRSSLAAARYADQNPDLKAIAAEAGVDAVLTGTLVRAGDQIRVTSQLVEVPGGTVKWSKSAQMPLGDIFQLQDELVQQIVASLAAPLGTGERAGVSRDVPANSRAYELYVRANHLAYDTKTMVAARDRYRESLAEDPLYAPAWARLGRVCRVIAKFGYGDFDEHALAAAQAFRRALELNPDLAVAHNLYTYFEVENLASAPQAMLRLMDRARLRPTDPDLFSGLVVACRFCGLLDASVAADRRARRLDPTARTSVNYTYFMRGDYQSAIRFDDEAQPYVRSLSLALTGHEAEALQSFREFEARALEGFERSFVIATRAALAGDRGVCVATTRSLVSSPFPDPEGLYLFARNLARIGETAFALEVFERAVEGGFFCHATFVRDPWLDSVRGEAAFVRILRRAESRSRDAAASIAGAGGERLLGISTF